MTFDYVELDTRKDVMIFSLFVAAPAIMLNCHFGNKARLHEADAAGLGIGK